MIVAAAAESVRAAAGHLEGVELRGLDARMEDVEFLVPQWGTTPDLTAMRALRVVQVMSAGTDWIDPLVPEGVTLCNARGSRDLPVAEWVVGAILGAVHRAVVGGAAHALGVPAAARAVPGSGADRRARLDRTRDGRAARGARCAGHRDRPVPAP